ncbi:hypothetical protein KC952_02300 [Candidatus Saccharibacteria bacterium]|nr:hypothetical protein [Candidatus Saccharibacteria bacterium]
MTTEEIYKELGIENADAEIKEATLVSIVELANLRLLELVANLVDEQQAAELQQLVRLEDISKWIDENTPEIANAYDAIVRDVIVELQAVKLG